MSLASKIREHFSELFGFACFQGYLFALFYSGQEMAFDLIGASITRSDLLFTFVAAGLCLLIVRNLDTKVRERLVSPALMYLYALFLMFASLVGIESFGRPLALLVVAAIVKGVSVSLLLCAWGKIFGSLSLDDSSFVVIAGSMFGAVACLLCVIAPAELSLFVIDLLPLGVASSLNGRLTGISYVDDAPAEQDLISPKIRDLSARTIVGALAFGLAAGFADSFTFASYSSAPTFPFALFVLLLLTIAALQLFFQPVGGSSRTGQEQKALQFAAPSGALAYLYRLSILLMLGGFLSIPALERTLFNGQSLVSAGFFGLFIVFIIVFVINAATLKISPMSSFTAGFAALFGGEALGIALGNGLGIVVLFGDLSYLVFALAGLLVLVSFLFLFTENDLSELTQVAEALDTFDKACEYLVSQFGLSKREAEILPLALKGRTGERIAEQFVISKSTVDTHLRRIYAKCGVHSRQELIDLGETTAELLVRQRSR